ncbi:MAG: hypothetical protein ACYDA2_00935 [Acidimicrobiales bacterium]
MTPGKISLATTAPSATTTYTIPFSAGGTYFGAETLTFVAPNGTSFPSAVGDYTVAVSQGSANLSSVAVSSANGSQTPNKVAVNLSASVAGPGANFTVTIGGVQNPPVASDDDTIIETTSVDTNLVPSPPYTIAYSSPTSGTPTFDQQETVNPGPAAIIAFSQQPAGVTAGNVQVVAVRVEDAAGNPVADAGAAVTLSINGVNGTSNPTAAQVNGLGSQNTDGTGQAGFGVSVQPAGSYDLTASATIGGNAVQTTSQIFTVLAGAPASVSITSAAVSAVAGGLDLYPVTANVKDQYGNPISGRGGSITFSSTSSTVTFSPNAAAGNFTTTVDPVNGGATVYFGDTVAEHPPVTATVGTVHSTPQTESVAADTTTNGSPDRVVLSDANPSGSASTGATIGAFTATLEDAPGNVVKAASAVTIRLASTSSSGVFSMTSGGGVTTTVTIASGQSSTTFYYGDRAAGTPTVIAYGDPSTSPYSGGTLVVAVGADTKGPQRLIFSTAPKDATAGTSQPVTVQQVDQFGNSSPVAGTAVTVGVSPSPGNLVSGNTASTGANGMASFPSFEVDKIGSFAATASATGLTSSPTIAFSVAPGAPSKLGFNPSTATTPVSATPNCLLQVQIQDKFGNATPTAARTTVTLSTPATHGAFSPDANGSAVGQIVFLPGQSSYGIYYGDTTTGSDTLTAASSGLTSGTATITLTTKATQVVLSATNEVAAASATADLGAITVSIEDQFGNLVPQVSDESVALQSNSAGVHTFSATSGGSGATSVVVPAGSSSTTFFYGDERAGHPLIQALASGLTPGGLAVTVTPANESRVAFLTPPASGNQMLASGETAAIGPFTAEVQDQFGNPVPQLVAGTMTLASSSATGVFAAPPGTTYSTTTPVPAGSADVIFFYGDTKVGTPTITASFAGITSPGQVVNVKSSTDQLVVTGSSPSGQAASTAKIGALTVTLEDSTGHAVVTPSPITVSLSSTSPGVYEFSTSSGGANTTTVTIAAASSSTTFYYGDEKTGTPTVVASAPSETSGAVPVTVTPAPIAQVVFTTPPQVGSAGTSAVLGPITAEVRDAFGNPAVQSAATALTLASSSYTAVFSATNGGTSETTGAIPAGSADTTFYYGDTAAGSPTLTASIVVSSATVSGVQSQSITPDAPVGIVLTTQPYTATTSPAPNMGAIGFTVVDQFGNASPVGTNTPVYLSSTSSSGLFGVDKVVPVNDIASLVLRGPAPTLAPTSSDWFFYGDPTAGQPTVIGSFSPSSNTGGCCGNGGGDNGGGGNAGSGGNGGTGGTGGSPPTRAGSPYGYYEVAKDGGIFAFGAPFAGSMGGRPLNAPIVAMAWDPQTGGYWLVGSDGGIFAFNAPFLGSMGGHPLNAPIVGMAYDAATGGYWLVAADGGIFAFNAPYYGSMGGHPLSQPIVGMAYDAATGGYWLVAADGGIFAFDAPFLGSMGGHPLNKPVVGMAYDAATGGYWLVASDGGLFAFGAPFAGSMGGQHLNQPIVAMAYDPDTGGYWEFASDGGVFAFNAPFRGSMGGVQLAQPVVGAASGHS